VVLTEAGSVKEWLKSLDIKVRVAPFNDIDLARTTQLLNKTNQMNLTTRRMTEKELREWAGHPSRRLWTFRVCDKFGDSGLTGVASVEINGSVGQLVDFILSCRVFGREIEDLMFYVVYSYSKRNGATKFLAQYLPTAKNKPCLEFLERIGSRDQFGQDLFVWDMQKECSVPQHLSLEILDETSALK
jgi:FkbH-like protein